MGSRQAEKIEPSHHHDQAPYQSKHKDPPVKERSQVRGKHDKGIAINGIQDSNGQADGDTLPEAEPQRLRERKEVDGSGGEGSDESDKKPEQNKHWNILIVQGRHVNIANRPRILGYSLYQSFTVSFLSSQRNGITLSKKSFFPGHGFIDDVSPFADEIKGTKTVFGEWLDSEDIIRRGGKDFPDQGIGHLFGTVYLFGCNQNPLRSLFSYAFFHQSQSFRKNALF